MAEAYPALRRKLLNIKELMKNGERFFLTARAAGKAAQCEGVNVYKVVVLANERNRGLRNPRLVADFPSTSQSIERQRNRRHAAICGSQAILVFGPVLSQNLQMDALGS